MSDNNSQFPPAPREPKVRGVGLAVVFLLFGVGNLLSALFPRTEAELGFMRISLIGGLLFVGIGVYLLLLRRRDVQAHAKWEDDVINWKHESMLLERQALETRLELEKAQLAEIKARAAEEFGGDVVEELPVVGTARRQDVIQGLGYENEEYHYSKRQIQESCLEDEEIRKLAFPDLSVALVPDRENAHDSNAVKVLLDGEFVGYIPAEASARIRSLMDQGKILKVSARIVGGPYKIYDSEEEDFFKKDLLYGVRLDLRIRK